MSNTVESNKPNWLLRHPVIEAIVTLVAASIAWLPPFDDTKSAYLIAVLGVLFAVGRFGLNEVLKDDRQNQEAALAKRFEQIDRLAEVVDLSRKSDVGELRSLVDRYTQIVDPEFVEAKEEVVHAALTRLNTILQERRTDKLSTGAYYKFLLELLASVKPGETLFAVSTGEDVEWDDSPQEERFFDANNQIVVRGGSVIRYFVYPKSGFIQARKDNQKIAAHFEGTRLGGMFIDKDKLKTMDAALYSSIGQGFIMVERRIAVVDVFRDQPRGYVTKNRDELDRYWKALQQLNQLAGTAPSP